MTAWTLVGGLMLISAVTLTILSVVRLDGRFRGEQQGLPANPDDEHADEAGLHPSGT
jgi:hypothetical protein